MKSSNNNYADIQNKNIRVLKFELSNWINNLLIWPIAIFFLSYSGHLLKLHGDEYTSGLIVFKILNKNFLIKVPNDKEIFLIV